MLEKYKSVCDFQQYFDNHRNDILHSKMFMKSYTKKLNI